MLPMNATVVRLFDDIRVVVRYLMLRRQPVPAPPRGGHKAHKDAAFIRTQPFF